MEAAPEFSPKPPGVWKPIGQEVSPHLPKCSYIIASSRWICLRSGR